MVKTPEFQIILIVAVLELFWQINGMNSTLPENELFEDEDNADTSTSSHPEPDFLNLLKKLSPEQLAVLKERIKLEIKIKTNKMTMPKHLSSTTESEMHDTITESEMNNTITQSEINDTTTTESEINETTTTESEINETTITESEMSNTITEFEIIDTTITDSEIPELGYENPDNIVKNLTDDISGNENDEIKVPVMNSELISTTIKNEISTEFETTEPELLYTEPEEFIPNDQNEMPQDIIDEMEIENSYNSNKFHIDTIDINQIIRKESAIEQIEKDLTPNESNATAQEIIKINTKNESYGKQPDKASRVETTSTKPNLTINALNSTNKMNFKVEVPKTQPVNNGKVVFHFPPALDLPSVISKTGVNSGSASSSNIQSGSPMGQPFIPRSQTINPSIPLSPSLIQRSAPYEPSFNSKPGSNGLGFYPAISRPVPYEPSLSPVIYKSRPQNSNISPPISKFRSYETAFQPPINKYGQIGSVASPFISNPPTNAQRISPPISKFRSYKTAFQPPINKYEQIVSRSPFISNSPTNAQRIFPPNSKFGSYRAGFPPPINKYGSIVSRSPPFISNPSTNSQRISPPISRFVSYGTGFQPQTNEYKSIGSDSGSFISKPPANSQRIIPPISKFGSYRTGFQPQTNKYEPIGSSSSSFISRPSTNIQRMSSPIWPPSFSPMTPSSKQGYIPNLNVAKFLPPVSKSANFYPPNTRQDFYEHPSAINKFENNQPRLY